MLFFCVFFVSCFCVCVFSLWTLSLASKDDDDEKEERKNYDDKKEERKKYHNLKT